ncbi:DUF2213 domain-containing protein, partial [Patescibacteria group bacterium]|nr:DUF2213 domain-containing protein [Patescibacteria group bacterium]
MFTTLTFNLANAAIRQERLHDRDYTVAPLAMLTEGVHRGSGGPLLYQEVECKRAVPAWNMKPIVVYHPQINGQGVSACDPDILERQQIGMLMNTRWDGKLRAEAWIDQKRARAVDSRVLDALEANKMMEVSTGLFTDNVGEPGEWNGEAYDAIATNHQPDHLALLPDKVGACSIADGAGLLMLNETAKAEGLDLTGLFARQLDIVRRMVGNAMSHSNIHSALHKALVEKLGQGIGKDPPSVWIVDVYDSFFVYEHEDEKRLFKLGFSSSDTGVEITGEPEEVLRVTEYRTVGGAFVGNSVDKEGETPSVANERRNKMEKDKLIEALIANARTKWSEEDREALTALEAAVLEKILPTEEEAEAEQNEAGEKPALEEKPAPEEKPVTMEQYVRNAPLEFRD